MVYPTLQHCLNCGLEVTQTIETGDVFDRVSCKCEKCGCETKVILEDGKIVSFCSGIVRIKK